LLTKKLYGKDSEVMVEELLRLGRATVWEIIFKAYGRIIADNENTSEDIDKHLIQR